MFKRCGARRTSQVLQGLAIGTLATGMFAHVARASVTYPSASVSAQANIFGAGFTSPPDPGGTIDTSDGSFGGGILPPEFDLPANPTVLTFSSVTGTMRLDPKYPNDPDGVGGEHTQSSVTSYNSIAGNTAPDSGYLTGVFETNAAPSGTTPARLNFLSSGLTTSFASLSPALNQTFFIGDGLTGDGTGAVQQFVVPAGATRLYLGICDGPGDSGAPGDYDDNTGAFTATFSIATVPEPTFAALGSVVVPLLMVRRSRSPVGGR